MPQRNVMPTLPNPNQQRQQAPKKPQQGGGGINIKALVIFGVIVVGVVILISVRGCSGDTDTATQNSLVESIPETTPEVTTSMTEPVELDPSENSGSVLTDILAEGSVFADSNQYILVTDIAYEGAQTLADSTVISMDKNLTIVPNAQCAYSYEFNSANIAHSSGAILYIQRRQATDSRNMPAPADFKESLKGIAKSNGISNAVFGDVYVGTEYNGAYVKGTLKLNNQDTNKTLLIMHVNGNPEIYSIAIIYNTADELDILLNSVRLFSCSLRLD